MENYFQMNFTPQQVNAISNLGLAHIGDGVYAISSVFKRREDRDTECPVKAQDTQTRR